jgi:hypothetical protein
MRKAAIILAIFVAALAAAPRAVIAADAPSVWSGLVLATDDDHPKEAPSELRRFKGKLEGVFGYNQFELLGQHTEKMDDLTERWLIPGRDFSMRVETKISAGKTYVLQIELFQGPRSLATIETRLAPQSPLFIRGPMCGGGQLIIVLLVK